MNAKQLLPLIIAVALVSKSHEVKNVTSFNSTFISTLLNVFEKKSPTSADDHFISTTTPTMPMSPSLQTLPPWIYHYGRWTEYDQENLTSFVDGLVTLQAAFCPHAPLCGNSSEFRGKQSCSSGYICEGCECDPECVEYGDCCPDTIHRYGLPKSGNEFQCVHQNIKNIVQIDRAGYKMITKCPPSFTEQELKTKCENRSIIDDIMYPPVTFQKYRRTYRNIFCAKCHSVMSYISWTLAIECYLSVDIYFFETVIEFLQEIADNPYCSLYNVEPRNMTLRQCLFSEVVDQCNATGHWNTYDSFLEKACSAYTAVVQEWGPIYRNTFCFLCNGFRPIGDNRVCLASAGEILVSLATLLNFNRDKPTGVNRTDPACGMNEMYDMSKKICRNVSCPLGMQDVNGTCTPFMKIITGARYRFSAALIPLEGDIRIPNDTSVWLDIAFNIKGNLPNWSFKDSIEVESYCSYLKIRHDSDETCLPDERLTFLTKLILIVDIKVTRESANRTELENSLREFFNIPWNFNIAKLKHCFRPITDTEALETELIMDGVLKDEFIHQECAHCDNQTFGLCFHQNTGPKPMRISELLYCRQVELFESEYVTLENSTDLHIVHLNRTIDAYLYNIAKSGKARICLDYYVNITREAVSKEIITSPYSVIEGYLSLVCTCLSMICILCILITYFIFPSLRTQPGVNNIFLVITLLLAQGCFQFGAGYMEFVWFCRIMGMFIHYLWLSTFCWLNICSYHMYKTFSDTYNVRSFRSTSHVTARYCAYAFFSPAVMVGVTVGCHVAVFGTSEIGYGGTMCYLSSRLARGLAFALPLGLIIICNVVFFAITMHIIRSTPIVASTAERTHHTIVYVKLSTLTGMTWVFGYAAEISLFQPLFYIFIVLGGCQGVFIFFSYICSRRVALLYTNLVKGSESENSNTLSRSRSTNSTM